MLAFIRKKPYNKTNKLKEWACVKIRRSERLIDMTHYLLNHPHELISLSFFSKRYASAKSSISEDLAIIKKTFKERGTGTLDTIPASSDLIAISGPSPLALLHNLYCHRQGLLLQGYFS